MVLDYFQKFWSYVQTFFYSYFGVSINEVLMWAAIAFVVATIIRLVFKSIKISFIVGLAILILGIVF